MRTVVGRLVFAALLSGSDVWAVELAEGKLSLNGAGQAAYVRTDGNEYFGGVAGGEMAAEGLSLFVTALPADSLSITTQLRFSDSRAEAEWAFAEWRISDSFRLRGGKVKQPLGLYSENAQAGTLRPFFHLPQSLYGPANITAEAYVGLGLTGDVPLGRWSLRYDAYFGSISLLSHEPFSVLEGVNGEEGGAGAPSDDEVTEKGYEVGRARNSVGGRLTLLTPAEGLSFGLSGYQARFEEAGSDGTQAVVGASVEYLNGPWTLRTEAFLQMESAEEWSRVGYVEGAYFLTEHWQLGLRADYGQVWFPEEEGHEQVGDAMLRRHTEGAVAVNYWFSNDLVLKAHYLFVFGNRFAAEEGKQQSPSRTHAAVIGIQFSF